MRQSQKSVNCLGCSTVSFLSIQAITTVVVSTLNTKSFDRNQ